MKRLFFVVVLCLIKLLLKGQEQKFQETELPFIGRQLIVDSFVGQVTTTNKFHIHLGYQLMPLKVSLALVFMKIL